ncbi:hypothetical protein E3N88_31841 [Mikania micrantha]|uniref:Uncharacterized protein n=1 Tax=Mikania micrantha TaxID=192012 RepID=A0A5N6M747_9ASTR|nr:hypothetical protein E3N88_31841 [Mikania micrantha]
MAIAELFIGALITVLFEKLASGDLIKLAQSAGIHSELKKLRENLALIRAVLVDASQKHITDTSVELWLKKLQHLAYEIEDVLDDLVTEATRRRLNQESYANTSTSKIKKFIPNKFNAFKYGHKMGSKLDGITTKLLDLVKEKQLLGLNDNVVIPNRTSRRLEETSLVEKSKIIGREGDKQALLSKLLDRESSSSQNINVLSIVGLGGIGKTTLCQLLYNDEEVKSHFELMSWVCVSEEFDVFSISKTIFKDVGGEDKRFENLNQLQEALKEKLSKKRFLIVLDDVWNEDYNKWELLQRPFTVGAPGSKILVTTRKEMVELVMESVQSYPLELLTDEESLSLFRQHASGKQYFDVSEKLEMHGDDIVKKCGNLPLALRTLGRLFRTKLTVEEWDELLKSEIWKSKNESDILPALMLSYYDLPAHLKQIFVYCSLFPKDYLFDKDELVLLWMAEGFLHESNGNKPMEIFGREGFEELVSRSFFQHSTNDKSRYTMHNLINHLARSVAREFFLMLDNKMNISDANEVPKLQFLRVLSLANYNITEVPPSVCSLKHLRYINFSNTKITCLPEHVGDLQNLQSLLLSGCLKLSSLPTSTSKLINLRHLDISSTPNLKTMPLGIGGLTGLQTLTKVIIGEDDEFKVSDLKGFLNIQGHLLIEGLDKVKNAAEAKEATLHQKKGIYDMQLQWSDGSRDEKTEYEVLDGLRPFEKLTSLSIMYYMGEKFPSWVGHSSFVCLTVLALRFCKSCKNIPALGLLPLLKKLLVAGMDGLERLGSEFLAHSNSRNVVAFPSLEVLTLKVSWCKKLLSFGDEELQSVKEVEIEFCGSLKSYNCPSRVEKLEISNCSSLTSLSFPTVDNIQSTLKSLYVSGCDNLEVSWLDNKFLSSLEHLYIWNTVKLSLFPEGCLVHITKLVISGCDNIESMPDNGYGFLPSRCLRYLHIDNCEKLKSFPHQHMQSLESLEEMIIRRCPNLDDTFPCGSWPPNLSTLRIGGLKKPISEWGMQNFPTTLVTLGLYGGEDSGLVTFADTKVLPSSLTSLNLFDFKELESLSQGLQHLTCLQHLQIYKCLKLRDLPETLLPSLLSLTMNSERCSQELREKCSRSSKGKYWPIISQIPDLDID